MNGSLALSGGILTLARHARSVEIRTYDLDGGRIGAGFSFAGLAGGRARADGIAVDRDMKLRVADSASLALRTFSVFGVELDSLTAAGAEDRAGNIGEPVACAVDGIENDLRVLVGSRGIRRHAVQAFDRAGNHVRTLRSRGDANEAFREVVRVAIDGRFQTVCDAGTGLIQVFRDGEFHFALKAPRPRGARVDATLTAARRLSDGRFVVATAGVEGSGVHLIEATGRLIHSIALAGERTSEVFEPSDIALDESTADRRSRIAVVDCDGDRVQVYNLEGVCYGSFADLPRAEDPVAEEST
ncbi:MAG: hypothetical protein SGI72_09570 [Planctomycetota bacterium]|nr:hypothetical protein [Planctomycetota bacterium]